MNRRNFLLAAPAFIAAPMLMKVNPVARPIVPWPSVGNDLFDFMRYWSEPRVLWPSPSEHILDAVHYGLRPKGQAKMIFSREWLKELERYGYE